MTVMNFLRALADLGFYYSFAGIFSVVAGGRLALAAMLLQSACFALSSAVRRSRIARTLALVPALLLLVLPVAWADRIVSIPPALYLAYLAWTDRYQLSWRRHADQLTTFLKVFPVAAFLMVVITIFTWDAAVSAAIPIAFVTVTASVLLTRSLRHNPEVYLQPKYQLVNFAGIALLTLAALVLGSEWAVRTAISALGAVYNTVIAPLLLGMSMVIAYLFAWLIPLLTLLVNRSKANVEEMPDNSLMEEIQGEITIEDIPPSKIIELLEQIGVALAIIAVVVLLFLLFRWMARPRRDTGGTPDLTRSSLPERQQPARRARAGTYASRIRRQYQAFLRLCQNNGLQFKISDTSTDVGEKSLDTFPDKEAVEGLRDIYQQARYQGEATREDYQQFKRLLGVLKKAQSGN